MIKSVQLKFSKIKYRGDSIGDDIRVEIEVLGKFLRIDKKIKAGTTVEIHKEVGKFETDRGVFYVDVLCTVTEKDLLFNDVGSARENIRVHTDIINPQSFVFEVQVRETRSILGKFWGTKTAHFEITLQTEVSDAVRFVPDLDESQGFLKVKLEDSNMIIDLPAYLKLKIERKEAKREYFTILEGPYRDKSASVKLRDNGSSWFLTEIQNESMISAKYSISQKTLIVKGKKYETVDYHAMPWEKGLYDVEIPDYPHEGGRNHLDQSKRAMTWFRIGHSGERYLHAGGYSLGCMTVIEVTRWMKIYEVLIKARKGDSMSVGILEVID